MDADGEIIEVTEDDFVETVEAEIVEVPETEE